MGFSAKAVLYCSNIYCQKYPQLSQCNNYHLMNNITNIGDEARDTFMTEMKYDIDKL